MDFKVFSYEIRDTRYEIRKQYCFMDFKVFSYEIRDTRNAERSEAYNEGENH